MSWRFFFLTSTSIIRPSRTLTYLSLRHNLDLVKPYFSLIASPFSTSFLVTKTPKKLRKKCKIKESPRTKLVQTEANRIPHFETIVECDSHFKFLIRSKQLEHVLYLDDAGKLYHKLGFRRGRKVSCSIKCHPLIFKTYRHIDCKMWFGFTNFREELLSEEQAIMDSIEIYRVNRVRKLLIMSTNKCIPL